MERQYAGGRDDQSDQEDSKRREYNDGPLKALCSTSDGHRHFSPFSERFKADYKVESTIFVANHYPDALQHDISKCHRVASSHTGAKSDPENKLPLS
jgi:hypothetical protein